MRLFPTWFRAPLPLDVLVRLLIARVHSTQEKRIIEHPQSCYVIGRSGTGYVRIFCRLYSLTRAHLIRKTTTMLFKMLLVERTFQLMESDLPRPRQVFVTKSRMLAKKVQEYFSKLASSLVMASQTFAELMRLPKSAQYQEDDLGLVDVDDIIDWRSDLPAKFSELEEKHFPLFITFDGVRDHLFLYSQFSFIRITAL